MIKAVLRLLGLISLALALIAVVLDLTRSIADSAVVITPLGKDWFDLAPGSLNLSQAIVQRYVHPYLWDPVIQWILQVPSWVVFGILAALFLWLARNRTQDWREKYKV